MRYGRELRRVCARVEISGSGLEAIVRRRRTRSLKERGERWGRINKRDEGEALSTTTMKRRERKWRDSEEEARWRES